MPVATFDFKIDDLLGSIFSFTEDEVDKFPFSFEQIGYGNNAITNMGSIFVVNMYQNVFMMIFVLLVVFGCTKEFSAKYLFLKLQLL